MKRGLLLLLLAFVCIVSYAQRVKLEDSLEREYAHAATIADRLKWLRELSAYYMGIDNVKSQRYGAMMIEIADSSRDREMMCRSYLYNADRYYSFGALQQYVITGLDYSQKSLDIARASNLQEWVAWSYIFLARGQRANGQMDKALNYNNLALSLIADQKNDSLRVAAYNSLGTTYLYKDEKLLAFRNYLLALNMAEETNNPSIILSCYSRMSEFYTSLENIEKAKDFEFKREALQRKENKLFDLLNTYNNIGTLYVRAKQTELALRYYEKGLALADSLNFGVYKLTSSLSIVNMYMFNREFQKSLDYFNQHPEVRDFLHKADLAYLIDNIYGAIYTMVGKLDSAQYHLSRAEPLFDARGNLITKHYFYLNYAYYFRQKKDYDNAINYYLKAKTMSEQAGNLQLTQDVTTVLDSVYQWKGDYKNAYLYGSLAYRYKDSLQKMAKEKDLLSLEIDNENKRKEREVQRQLAETRRSHNIQYMGITVAVACIFILLVMAGVFSVSRTTVKIIGFFAFIFLFEFIILLADNQIHAWTHGEPWKVMLFKIALIAILLPLHHWMEEKAIHYLTSQHLLRIKGKGILGKLFRKKDADLPMGNL